MKSINEVILTAGLTKDAEVKTHKDANGNAFHNCSLNLAFTKTIKNREGNWEDVPMYIMGYYITRSEKLLPLLTKGTQIVITATLDQFVTTKDQQRVTCLTIKDLRLMSSPKPAAPAPQTDNSPFAMSPASEDDDEYVPF